MLTILAFTGLALLTVAIACYWGARTGLWSGRVAKAVFTLSLIVMACLLLLTWLPPRMEAWAREQERERDRLKAEAEERLAAREKERLEHLARKRASVFSEQKRSDLLRLLRAVTREEGVAEASMISQDTIVHYFVNKSTPGVVAGTQVNVAGMGPDPEDIRVTVSLPEYSYAIDLRLNGHRVCSEGPEFLQDLRGSRIGLDGSGNWHLNVQLRYRGNIDEKTIPLRVTYKDDTPLSQQVRVAKEATVEGSREAVTTCFGFIPSKKDGKTTLYVSVKMPPLPYLDAQQRLHVMEDTLIASHPLKLRIKNRRTGAVREVPIQVPTKTFDISNEVFDVTENEVGAVYIEVPPVPAGMRVEVVKVVRP